MSFIQKKNAKVEFNNIVSLFEFIVHSAHMVTGFETAFDSVVHVALVCWL